MRSRWDARRGVPGELSWLMATAGLLLAISAVALRKTARLDFYLDEIWRVDMIRSADTHARYVLHDTPIPPGWLYLMKALAAPLPDRRIVIRVVAQLALPIGLFTWTPFARRLFVRLGAGAVRAKLWATCSVASVMLFPGLFAYEISLSNYGFEVLYAALIVLTTYRVLERRPYASATSAVLVALAPFMVQSALFGLPIAVFVLLRHASSVGLRRVWLLGAATSAGFIASAAAAYAWFYRPVLRSGTTDFWVNHTFANPDGFAGLRATYTAELRVLLLGGRAWGPLSIIVVVCCAVAGVVAFARVARLLLVFVAVGQGVAVVAAIAAGWPLTPVRVNFGFVFIALFTVTFGFWWLIELALSVAQRQSRLVALSLQLATVIAGLVVVDSALPRSALHNGGSGAVFARGLSEDLRSIARQSSGPTVVVMYHRLSHWYANDVLTNGSWRNETFTVLREGGPADLYNHFDQSVAPHAKPGGDVWCVIPYEVGPEGSAAACRPTTDRFIEIGRTRANRAQLVHLRVALTPSA